MSLFVISDLHLSTADQTKSMEVFGDRWKNYMEKIKKNWNSLVSPEDTVILPGDLSWALTLSDAESDMRYINGLNGTKLLGKGNHDFWWSTAKKMIGFFAEKGFDTLKMLYNNAYIVEDRIICGTRGWFPDETQQTAVNNADYGKIVNRECIRLRMGLEAAKKLQGEHKGMPIHCFLHFPPVWGDHAIEELVDLLSEYGVRECFYGHIHGNYSAPGSFVYKDIKFTLISADFLSFYPLKI